ncbi:conserved hypothetical protein [Roseibium sp. TrichSKD4]|nr:conserved hypothetical protein [Roseibium sp. TrichSKD4]
MMTKFGHLMFDALSLADMLSVTWFLFAWFGFNLLIDISPFHKKSLSHAMDQHRRQWMMAMASREVRIMDTAIMGGLQQGTAFFASMSLLAIGGSFALLDSPDTIQRVAGDLSIPVEMSRTLWELKVLGLGVIFAYAFFKFGWAYRLFNYASIVMGSVPEHGTKPEEDLRYIASKAADLNVLAGRHFNRGQRAFFFAIAFLGWFAGPAVFACTTLAVLLRRQFLSRARAAALFGQRVIPPSDTPSGK